MQLTQNNTPVTNNMEMHNKEAPSHHANTYNEQCFLFPITITAQNGQGLGNYESMLKTGL